MMGQKAGTIKLTPGHGKLCMLYLCRFSTLVLFSVAPSCKTTKAECLHKVEELVPWQSLNNPSSYAF